jgi:hypothetical protein
MPADATATMFEACASSAPAYDIRSVDSGDEIL